MKARTREEKRVERLSQALPALTPSQERWVKRNAVKVSVAYSTGKTQWCTKCGGIMEHGKTICPHCNSQLNVIKSARRTLEWNEYVTIHTTRKNYQIARYFIYRRYSRKGRPCSEYIYEVCQEWLNADNGKITIMAKDVNYMHPWLYDCWRYETELNIKHKSDYYYSRNYNRYSIWSKAERWYGLLPVLAEGGATRKNIDTPRRPMDTYPRIIRANDEIGQHLYRAGQMALFERHLDGKETYPYAVRICNRHHYIIKDAQLWCDHIHLLRQLGKDTRNPHYICPQDLMEAHIQMNRLMQKKIEKQRAKQRAEEEKRRLYEEQHAEEIYNKLHRHYLAVYFGNEEIEIKVAQSVQEIYEEGKAMHHCVYNAGYYKKPNSLILFARKRDTGERLETIEIHLDTFKVAQSRGVCNQPSEYHDAIVDLCNKNMHLLKAVA
jgi:RNA polymerase subunit RPABC4/transcription elongation factor Spt4